ncbi:MAG: hypothetical protein GXO23_07230 [Crenarchaeota archaeon]|nr:hypothetical protein [Thermoproteota archaeon]
MSEEVRGRTLAVIDIRGHTIHIVKDESTGNVYMYERWSEDEDLVEVELGTIDEEGIYEEIVRRIDEELKLPRPVRGRLKAKLKELKIPVSARLVEREQVTILDIKGQKGRAQLIARFSIQ